MPTNNESSPQKTPTFVQIPSQPNKTSASKAFVQAFSPPGQDGTHRHYFETETEEEKRAREELLKKFHAYAGEHAEYNAYSLLGTDEGPERDDTNDEWKFEIEQGLFRQSDQSLPRLSPEEMLASSFGLVDKSPERWSNFKSHIASLSSSAPSNVHYKVLFLGRHGQGFHNLASAKYEPLEWEMDICRRNGDNEYTWGPDAELTELGQGQARAVYAGWKENLANGAPRPQSWLVSPLTRTADTMRLSFGDILDGETPVFKEAVREIYGIHTCDKRRSKTYLKERFPNYAFEEGFSEEDPWWKPDEREMEGHRRQRLRKAMFDLFNDTPRDHTYVSITSHTCALRSLLATLNHYPVSLNTGEMIPVVVKATKQK